jgi:rare lipoprotein A
MGEAVMHPALRHLGALALGLAGLTACTRAVAPGPPAVPAPPRVGWEETGLASWYGHPYHGRRTSSGEVYDMHELTAAHRTLPLGTRLVVTHLHTGQAVEVRVNDRGPWVEGRILDLSYAAAQVLGGVGPGVIPVRIRVAGLPGSGGSAVDGQGYSVQVGAFTSRARAETLREALQRDGNPAAVSTAQVGGETFYRVRVGSYADRAVIVER